MDMIMYWVVSLIVWIVALIIAFFLIRSAVRANEQIALRKCPNDH